MHYIDVSIILVPDGPPFNITLMDADPAMLSVAYSPPEERSRNGDVIGYMIRYTILDTSVSQVMNVNDSSEDSQTSVLSGLVAFTDYSIEVAAVNVNGTGPFSGVVTGLSGEDSKQMPTEGGGHDQKDMQSVYMYIAVIINGQLYVSLEKQRNSYCTH